MLKYSRKLTVLFGVLALMLIIASGCSSGQKENSGASQGEGREIKHELGTAHISGTPKRVVVLENSFVDAVTKLGVKPVGIADDKKKDMIEKLVGEPIEYTSVGTRSEPNLEIISSLKPDLIIADAERHKNVYRDLKGIAPTIVLKSREATYQETIDGFQTIAKALNKEKEGKKDLADHQKQMNSLKSKLPKKKIARFCLVLPGPTLLTSTRHPHMTERLWQFSGSSTRCNPKRRIKMSAWSN